MPEGTRRSSRIPKEIAILLVGSDIEGRVFSEKTKTVVLSRYGAGIVSEYKLSAEQELFIRRPDTNVEAEVRIVGQLAAESGIYTYGVAFLDPSINFWGIDFPPPTDAEKLARRALLECSSCKGRETVEQSDLESDVFAINKSIVRYCKRCGSSTIWRVPSGEATQVASPARTPPPPPSPSPAPSSIAPDLEPEEDWAPQPSRYKPPGSEATPCVPEPAQAEAPASPSSGAPVRTENRRKHVRTKVNCKACVRYKNFADDIVTCEDMSRGGLRFKSRQRYVEKSLIRVAVPYSPGMPPIFVSAQIVFVQELPSEKLFRYGVAYQN